MVDGLGKVAPRAKISDLVTEYVLHPDSRHLYVEGEEDRAILLWYGDGRASRNVRVITAENVEVTEEEWRHHSLNGGNKDKLIILARELDQRLPHGSDQVLCIVDADFDYLAGRTEKSQFLAYTDGTSMDMYMFSESVLKRVLVLGTRNTKTKPKEILDILYEVLFRIFMIRAANEALKWNMQWLEHGRRCLVQRDGTIVFDQKKFIREYLGKNGKIAKKAEFLECVAELSLRPVQDRTQAVRGHDFTELAAQYLRKRSGNRVMKEIGKNGGVVRMLHVALDREELASSGLFRRVEAFWSR